MTESNFRFNPPYLTAMDFVINQSYRREKNEVAPVSLYLQTNVSRNPEDFDSKVELIVKLNHDDIGNSVPDAPFWITVSYSSKFTWEKGIPKEMVERFLRVNAPAVLLSYIRPLVAQITSCSPFPTYNIPFLNLVKMQEEAQEADRVE